MSTAPRRILYYQVTLGPAHEARVRALDAIPGFRCTGVALAARERTRSYPPPPDDPRFVTLLDGMYEAIPRWGVVTAVFGHLRATRPDVVIVDAPADFAQSAIGWWARRNGTLALTRWASLESDHRRQPLREWVKGFVYRGWDGYLATGSLARDYALSFGIPPERIHVCGNPVDGAAIEAAGARGEGTPREDVFLYVGRFLPFKNVDGLIRAFRAYRRSGGRWLLELVGFGPCEQKLRRLAEGEPAITFLGALSFPRLVERYLGAGCLVLPSHAEPWGLVVNEAMHAGLPVLVSDRCGCAPELVEEGANGFRFDPQRMEDLVAALERIEALGMDGRRALSVRARARIREESPDGWARRVADAIGSSPARP